MATAPHLARQEPHADRPVLGAAGAALDALAASTPERLWGLGDAEVAEAMALLGRLRASVDARLVAVLAEAKQRGLGSGDGWGPVDWARAMAPDLPTRTVTDLDVVAAATSELRLTHVVAAATEAAGSAPTGRRTGAGAFDMRGSLDDTADDDPGSGALTIGKAAQIVRFHRAVRGLADPDHLAAVTTIVLRAARGDGALSERGLATALRRAADQLRPDHLVEHGRDETTSEAGPGDLTRSRTNLPDRGSS